MVYFHICFVLEDLTIFWFETLGIFGYWLSRKSLRKSIWSLCEAYAPLDIEVGSLVGGGGVNNDKLKILNSQESQTDLEKQHKTIPLKIAREDKRQNLSWENEFQTYRQGKPLYGQIFGESVEDHIDDVNEGDRDTKEMSFLTVISLERRHTLKLYCCSGWDWGAEIKWIIVL